MAGIFDGQQNNGLAQLLALKQLAGGQGADPAGSAAMINTRLKREKEDREAQQQFFAGVEGAQSGEELAAHGKAMELLNRQRGYSVVDPEEILRRTAGRVGRLHKESIVRGIGKIVKDPAAASTAQALMATPGRGVQSPAMKALTKKSAKLPGVGGMVGTALSQADDYFDKSFDKAYKDIVAKAPAHARAGMGKEEYLQQKFDTDVRGQIERDFYDMVEANGGMAKAGTTGGHAWVDEALTAASAVHRKSKAEIEVIRGRYHKMLDDGVAGKANEDTQRMSAYRFAEDVIPTFFAGGSAAAGTGDVMAGIYRLDKQDAVSSARLNVYFREQYDKFPDHTVGQLLQATYDFGVSMLMVDKSDAVENAGVDMFNANQIEYAKTGRAYAPDWVSSMKNTLPSIHTMEPDSGKAGNWWVVTLDGTRSSISETDFNEGPWGARYRNEVRRQGAIEELEKRDAKARAKAKGGAKDGKAQEPTIFTPEESPYRTGVGQDMIGVGEIKEVLGGVGQDLKGLKEAGRYRRGGPRTPPAGGRR